MLLLMRYIFLPNKAIIKKIKVSKIGLYTKVSSVSDLTLT
jgi:hypothetical protein